MSAWGDEIGRYLAEHFPEGVHVPAGGSEADAIRSVQEQFDDAGLECSDETARGLVQEAWRRATE